MNAPTKIAALCVGEMLWDILPDGREPGGAPLNVAVQISCNGVSSGMVSRVGNDDLGKELIDFINEKGVTTDLIQVDDLRPTGTVEVTLDDKGSPEYNIVEGAAWDFIDTSFKDYLMKPQFIVFGTLASRNNQSYESILTLIKQADWPKLVYDLNLREPYIDKQIIRSLLEKSHIVKVNDEEFELLGEWYNINTDSYEQSLHQLQEKLPNLEIIILTKGAKGVTAWYEGNVTSIESFNITVVDTVGSGDALLGAFISQYYKKFPISDALRFACAAGAYVATQIGANPTYTEEIIFDFMNENTI